MIGAPVLGFVLMGLLSQNDGYKTLVKADNHLESPTVRPSNFHEGLGRLCQGAIWQSRTRSPAPGTLCTLNE